MRIDWNDGAKSISKMHELKDGTAENMGIEEEKEKCVANVSSHGIYDENSNESMQFLFLLKLHSNAW